MELGCTEIPAPGGENSEDSKQALKKISWISASASKDQGGVGI